MHCFNKSVTDYLPSRTYLSTCLHTYMPTHPPIYLGGLRPLVPARRPEPRPLGDVGGDGVEDAQLVLSGDLFCFVLFCFVFFLESGVAVGFQANYITLQIRIGHLLKNKKLRDYILPYLVRCLLGVRAAQRLQEDELLRGAGRGGRIVPAERSSSGGSSTGGGSRGGNATIAVSRSRAFNVALAAVGMHFHASVELC